jgi:arylsulfatase A-like enzyme
MVNHRLRRRVLIFGPIIAFFVFLLWPLSGREWDIGRSGDPSDGNAQTKPDLLAGQMPVRATAPRVIVIVADDLGPTDISLYGGRNVQTPNIDSIGTDGVTFTDASCTTAICAPSRASMLTGRYQQRFGFEVQPHDRYARSRLEYLAFRYFIDTDPMVPIAPAPIPSRSATRDQGVPENEVMLSELLEARGYETAVFGKWHLGYDLEFGPLARGFDEHYGFYEAFSLYAPLDDESVVHTTIDDFSDRHMWSQGRDRASAIVHNDVVVEESEYLTFRFAELAADYIAANADEPFFLYLPFSAPHTPLQAPGEYYNALRNINDPVRRTYYAMIAALDDAVGTVLEAVDDAGIAESTLVVFASDNGGVTYLGVTDNGPFAGGKFSNFHGGLSVPMMMRYPAAIPADTVYNEPVSLMDIFGTVEAVTRGDSGTAPRNPATAGSAVTAGLVVSPYPPPGERNVDGVNLLPYVLGDAIGVPHEALFWRSFYNRAVRMGPWKLIVQEAGSPGTGESDLELLFNLESDPYEQLNLAGDNPATVARLRAELDKWDATLAQPLWPPVMHFRMDVWGRRYWFAI